MKTDQTPLGINLKALISATMAVLFFSSLSFADIGDALVLCKHNKNVRTLRIEVGANQKCKAIYTKQGVDQMIGQSQEASACEQIISDVRKTLEKNKWNCRDVKEARSSTLNTNGDSVQ